MAKKVSGERFIIPKEFGEYLSSKRKAKGWTLETVAIKLNISRVYIGDIELARRPAPPKPILLLLAKIYEIDTSRSEMTKFLDLAAATRKENIPLDIETFLAANPQYIEFIRKILYHEFLSGEYINKLLSSSNRDCAKDYIVSK